MTLLLSRTTRVSPRYFSTDSSSTVEGEKPSTGGTPSPDLEKAHKELLAKKDSEIQELKDSYRRALADAENLRHRTQKELADKTAYAIQSFAKDLLTTADTLSLALNAVPEHERGEKATHKELKNLWVGVMLTQKELLKTFQSYGIEGYNPINEKFDFNLHTAIFQQSMPGKEPGTIFHVDKVGYKIKDRILRPANVGVVKDPEN